MERTNLMFKTHYPPVLSVFLKWYLRRETLVQNRRVKELLRRMDEEKVTDREGWENLLRFQITREALRGLKALLERPLEIGEVFQLVERIDEYLRLYAIGFRA